MSGKGTSVPAEVAGKKGKSNRREKGRVGGGRKLDRRNTAKIWSSEFKS